jgi:hypothetical protein
MVDPCRCDIDSRRCSVAVVAFRNGKQRACLLDLSEPPLLWDGSSEGYCLNSIHREVWLAAPLGAVLPMRL